MKPGFDVGYGIPIKDTGKALLVDIDGIGEVWIPLSAIHDDSDIWTEGQEEGNVVIFEWFAEKMGWL